MSFHTRRAVKSTRKLRVCYWCGVRIEVGEPAVRLTGVGPDGWYDEHLHPECDRACDEYVRRPEFGPGDEVPSQEHPRGVCWPLRFPAGQGPPELVGEEP